MGNLKFTIRDLLCLTAAIALALKPPFFNPIWAQNPSADKQTANEIDALIDKLQDVADEGIGYMSTASGSGFLPLGISKASTFTLGGAPVATSDTLCELVKRGADAIPNLVAHLGDKRPTKLTVKHSFEMFGFAGGMFFDDEYDFNARTSKAPPKGVNRSLDSTARDSDGHTVTVGDLCFVALGQIVNRRFNAVRYQSTACIMVNSPTGSEALRQAIIKEWGNLTPQLHKESLIQDFTQPDSEDRLCEACLRIGYYYPQSLEPLALQQLAQPRYDPSEVQSLIREKLYHASGPAERKKLFGAYVANHGEVARQAILVFLFQDLDTQEADEEHRMSPPLTEKYAARDSLVELFQYPKDVKSDQRPHLLPADDYLQARLIETLDRFPSAKIDQAVRQVFHSTDEDYLAAACARYLIGRGADADFQKYVDQRWDKADENRRKELEQMRERLGWTPLHAAAEVDDVGRLESLLHGGADVNARAANGQTALHVAAEHSMFGAIDALLKYTTNPNLKDQKGRTPVKLAIDSDSAVEMLLSAGAEPSDLLVASFAGSDAVVTKFLQNDKTLVSLRSRIRQQTALHIAVSQGNIEVVQTLLTFGADVNARDHQQFTPLHLAVMDDAPDMVALLLDHKADRNAKCWDGRIPLDFTESKDPEVARLLHEHP